MPSTYWGVIGEISLNLPETISGWLLLLCYAIFFMVLLIVGRARFSKLTVKQWILLVALSGLGLLLSQLFPLFISPQLANFLPHFSADDQATAILLISAVPYLLAGAILGAAPALIVGFITGVGHAIGLTHDLYTPFNYAFAAWLAAELMQQNYQGRVYRWLRLPLVGGVVGQTSTAVFEALVALVNTTGLMASLDAALAAFQTHIWFALVEGLVGGAIVTLLIKLMAQWLPQRQLVPSPAQRSVRSYLLTNFLFFGGVVMIASAVFVFGLSVFLSSRTLVTQMAASSIAASAQIEDFHSGLEDVLSQSREDDELTNGDKGSASRALGRLYSNAEHFQSVLLVGDDLSLDVTYPEEENITLSVAEQGAAERAIGEGLGAAVVIDSPDQGQMLSMIMPLPAENGQPAKALIGRVQASKLTGMLQDRLMDDGTGLIVDLENRVLASSSDTVTAAAWSNPGSIGAQDMFVPAYLGGDAFLMANSGNSRDIQYVTPPNGSSWRVVSTVPYEIVLNQAFASALPVVLVLLAVTGLFYGRFASYGQNLADPITNLAKASRSIAAGEKLATPVDVERQDEVGELGRAFTGMQQVLKGRMEELSLLLTVSQDVSSSVNINESMPVILQGALRGTGAAGARAVILNPSGRIPLSFAGGPAGDELAVLDHTLMTALRGKKELSIGSSRQMSQLLRSRGRALPVKAVFAIPLQLQNQFKGVFFLGYRQPRDFAESERHLLHTLAGQATVLVENAHLFAKAEGGRQRLTAVLSSTSEPVIVTDQTERILILNKAMERAFHISSSMVIGRTINDVIQSPRLMRALGQPQRGRRNLEIDGRDGRTYYANVSTIVGRRRQVMGRVAVLHDVTQLKEIDRMKSEFVSNVTHDLKTPLTVISGYASALAYTENLSLEQRQYTDNIVSGVNRMADLVDNLLDLGRLEAGIALVNERFAAEDLLTELVDDHWLHAHNSGVQLRMKVADDLPPISGDRAWLYQAISNLLANGFKYAPNSGEMILSAVKVEDSAVISLHDKGPGISRKDQLHLFEKFFRVKPSGPEKVKGTGLGLTIVKTVTERHGGHAWCQSELGKGSTFSISVPVEGMDEDIIEG